MNWDKLKEKFPKSEPEIRGFAEKTNYSGRKCIDEFLSLKGYEKGLNFIHNLKDYESKRKNN